MLIQNTLHWEESGNGKRNDFSLYSQIWPVNHSISKQPCCCHGTKPSWRVPGSHPLTADNGKRCLCGLTSANAAGHWWQPSFFWAPQTLFKIFTVSPMAVSSCLDGALSNLSFLSKQHSFPFHTSQQDTSVDHCTSKEHYAIYGLSCHCS